MKKFTIVKTIPSTTTEIYEVVANDLDEAMGLVDNGNGFSTSWTETHNSQERLRVENEEDGFMR
jgi:hypothetical protein